MATLHWYPTQGSLSEKMVCEQKLWQWNLKTALKSKIEQIRRTRMTTHRYMLRKLVRLRRQLEKRITLLLWHTSGVLRSLWSAVFAGIPEYHQTSQAKVMGPLSRCHTSCMTLWSSMNRQPGVPDMYFPMHFQFHAIQSSYAPIRMIWAFANVSHRLQGHWQIRIGRFLAVPGRWMVTGWKFSWSGAQDHWINYSINFISLIGGCDREAKSM